MDQEMNEPLETPGEDVAADAAAPQGVSRRSFFQQGLTGACAAALVSGGVWWGVRQAGRLGSAGVFKGDAPSEAVWEAWRSRGWVREARHYLSLGQNVQCRLCPNGCLLEPGDRSHCRNRVCRDGKLYTLAYANACSVGFDPIEKKPLFHYLPGTRIFSFASSGCGFRCLNCQNWDISQRKPEETKDISAEPIRFTAENLTSIARGSLSRVTLLPADAAAVAVRLGCPSIAYTYSEPVVWYEYVFDTAREARKLGRKNVWVTCGFIEPEPLAEIIPYLDAASVNLKSYSEEIYRDLNSGKLQPVLDTLVALRRAGVWVEVINLVVPTYTDKPDMIRRMCDWIVANLGPDCPLHFSRFHPAHKLLHLPDTPIDSLVQARDVARQAGLRYVYIGNAREPDDAETTYCPQCRKPVIGRQIFTVEAVNFRDGKCAACGTAIAGVWSA